MSFYADTLVAVQAAITARLAGGAVDHYVIGGDDISLMPLKDLFELEARLAPLALQETGQARSAILAKLSPFR